MYFELQFRHFLCLSLVFASGLACGKPDPKDPSTWLWNDPTELKGVTHGEIESDAMGRTMGYNIYLPPSYKSSSERRYPVVFWLHGAYGKENDIGLAMIAKQLIERDEIGEVIYVVANSGHFSRYRDWPNGEVMAETWVIRELIPEIDSRYRTLSRRSGRAIAGFSMGGEGALRFGFKYPEMFCAIGSFSPALHWPESLGEKVQQYSSEGPLFYAEQNKEKLSEGQMPLYLAIGDSERFFDDFPEALGFLHEREIRIRAQVFDGLEHNLGKLLEYSGEELVRFLSRHYDQAERGE
ncbi:alpha/beta hydrolase-fold protein [Pelagicoccus sp. SDUM812002]|uniref:alpha/beta hydrolase n=1 Tax=Pelagicoccus sp. SDUM812002 TaxID=3041266 RepID=UPI00280F6609|nr:alpha/beta hydrolase-fold protein [Pelagicoccus sp. SDUM812002]MDQ8188346.1 alpha/beta hydrolase-fold protein [Pelagicoccus sp. SDUM812002]